MPEESAEKPTILMPSSAEAKFKHSFSFENLHNRILSDDTDSSKRRELIGRQKKIMDRMENVGMVKWQDVENTVLTTVKRNDWDDVYPEVQSLGDRLENEAKGTAGYVSLAASEKERVENAVKIAVDMAALEVRVQGLVQRGRNPKPGDDYERFLHEHASSADRLEKDREKVVRGKVLFRNIETDEDGRVVVSEDPVYLAAHVGEDVVEPQEATFQRAGSGAASEDVVDLLERNLTIQEEILKATRQAGQEQHAYLEAVQQGYDGFVSTEYNRASVDPKRFHIDPPTWYRELSEREQKTVVTRTNITNLAAHIENYGMTHFDEVMGALGFRIEKEGLENMWNEMPGFRIAMATMVDNIFEKEGEDHLVISDQGYEIIKEFTQFKETMIDTMEKHLRENPHPNIERYYLKHGKDKFRAAAVAAVSAADNLLYAGSAYFSGDEDRAVRNTKIWQEQLRAFSMPGIKGNAKWIKRENVEDLPTGREEDWGGILGNHMQRRCSADGEFKRDFIQGTGRRYIPRRLFFSMFDHVYFKKRYSKEAFYDTHTIPKGSYPNRQGRVVDRDKATLAEALIYSRKKSIDGGGFLIAHVDDDTGERSEIDLTLKDYENPEQISFSQLEPDDLYGYYADVRSHAVPIYKHLTATDVTKALTASDFIKELNKLRSENPQLAGQTTPDREKWVLWDPDLFEGALAISILKKAVDLGYLRPGNAKLVGGTSEFLFTIPDSKYDGVVTNVLTTEPKLYYGMPPNLEEHFFRTFLARDKTKTSEVVRSWFADAPFSHRQSLREKAAEAEEEEVRRAQRRQSQ
ncbi:MAG: hypothetical protein NWE80_04145 [Candidatus Bathyarchaeota archaeon]|nr:hypothetical protein [Candidatus Bathyarchaeota archaeon]